MGTSARAVARGLLAAAALTGIMLAPMAAGVSQARGMRASGGGVRSSGSLGVRRGSAALSAGAMVTPGVRRGVMPGGGTAVRTMPSNGALLPPANFGVRPLAPGTVIIPVSPSSFFFPGGVISPLVPGTVVNPLFPGTIFVPLFPCTGFFPLFPGTVFAPVFPSTVFFPFAPSIINPLTPGVVPPLIPQFVLLPMPVPLTESADPAPATASSRAAATAARPAAPARTGGALWAAAPRPQPSNARALQQWVRTQNPGASAAATAWGRTGDAAAGVVPGTSGRAPADAGNRSNAIARAFGPPAHRVAFVPRTVFFDDFFTIDNGHLGFTQFRHHAAVTADVYYPHYVNDPSWFAFRHPGDYPSVYALWGWTPPWIAPDRVSYLPRNGLSGPSYLDYLGSGEDVDSIGAMSCIEGIRRAWLTGDPQHVAPYLSDQVDVRVYLNGKYEYSTPARDYYGMTVDVFTATRSIAFEFDNPVWLSASDLIVTGRNGFTGPDGNPKTVYVSYRVRRLGGGWYITDFGSSLQSIGTDGRELAS